MLAVQYVIGKIKLLSKTRVSVVGADQDTSPHCLLRDVLITNYSLLQRRICNQECPQNEKKKLIKGLDISSGEYTN